MLQVTVYHELSRNVSSYLFINIVLKKGSMYFAYISTAAECSFYLVRNVFHSSVCGAQTLSIKTIILI